MVVINDGMKGI